MKITINNDMDMNITIEESGITIKPIIDCHNLRHYEFHMDKYESAEELLSNIDKIYKNIKKHLSEMAILGASEG